MLYRLTAEFHYQYYYNFYFILISNLSFHLFIMLYDIIYLVCPMEHMFSISIYLSNEVNWVILIFHAKHISMSH